MFTLSRPLGRLPFLAGLSAVNILLAMTATLALTLLPASGFSTAAVVVVTALQGAWLVLHARRFADAGRGPGWPISFAATGFAVFLLGYLISASLWSVPEVQQEAFRTAGGIGTVRNAVAVNPLLGDFGRAMASVLGAAGALIVTGLVAIAMLLLAGASVVFSSIALLLPSGYARSAPPLPRAAAGRALP